MIFHVKYSNKSDSKEKEGDLTEKGLLLTTSILMSDIMKFAACVEKYLMTRHFQILLHLSLSLSLCLSKHNSKLTYCVELFCRNCHQEIMKVSRSAVWQTEVPSCFKDRKPVLTHLRIYLYGRYTIRKIGAATSSDGYQTITPYCTMIYYIEY